MLTTRTRCAAIAILLVAASFSTPVRAEDAEHAFGRKVIVPTDGSVTPSTGVYRYDPAGNVAAIGHSSYVYDPMSRVVTAEVHRIENVQSQTYTYDIYGNRTSDGVTSYTASLSTNRLTTQGAQYDAAGNLTQWQPPYTSTPRIYSYDALNTMMMEKVAVAGGEEYIAHIYTADDERYWSFRGGASGLGISRYWLRDLGGQVLRELSEPTPGDWSARDYIYREGLLLASHDTRTGDTHHYSLDHLGTPRVVTGQDAEKIAEHTYFPFGAEYTDGSATDGRLHFTGHEQRDADLLGENRGELDYMHARYYSANIGRFLSTDPVTGNRRAPQSFNRYPYALDNPTRYVDPDGRQINLSIGSSYIPDDFVTVERTTPEVDWDRFFSDFMSFSGGVANSFASNMMFGRGRYDRPGNDAYGAGQVLGDGLSMIAGAMEINAGISGTLAGTVLDLTGAGALVGVPVQIVSGAAIAHGGVTTAIAATHFMSGIKQRKFGKHGTFRGRDSKRANDSVIDRICNELDLTPEQRQRLHQEISGGDLSYEEILDLARAMFNK